MCIGAAILARVKRLVFAVSDPKGGACGSMFNIPVEPRLNHRLEVMGGILEQRKPSCCSNFFPRPAKKTGQSWIE